MNSLLYRTFSSLTIALAAACGPATLPDKGEVDAGQGAPVQPTANLTAPVVVEAVPSELDATKKYRLGLVWFQFDDDGPDPAFEIAVDLPFDASTGRVTLPSAFAPPGEQNLLCQRACDDESQCACKPASPYRLGFGALALVEDTNANGKIDIVNGDLEDASFVTGYGAIVYSANGGDILLGSDGQSALIDGEISKGATGYVVYRSAVGGRERLRLPAAGEVIRLSKTLVPNLG